MATLKSTNVNSGDPVTYDIINNIILDLNELNKATAAKFNLNLTQTGGKDGKDAVSQTIYSTTKLVKIKAATAGGTGATWDFSKAGFTVATLSHLIFLYSSSSIIHLESPPL